MTLRRPYSGFCSLPGRETQTDQTVVPGRELTPIRHLFEVARKEWGLPLRENPLAQLSIGGVDQRRERRLREGELARLLAAAKTSRNPFLVPIMLFALVTGMRRGKPLQTKGAAAQVGPSKAVADDTAHSKS
jgi:hypothetical protein